MNSKTAGFWGIMIAGVIVVSVAAWFIGNTVAGHVIKNRSEQKVEDAAPGEGKAFDRMSPDERAENISIDDPSRSRDDEETRDDETGEEAGAEDTEPADPDAEKIPSADAVSEKQPDGEAKPGDGGDELFGETGSTGTDKPAAGTGNEKPTKPETAQQPAAGSKKILYRVQIGAFSKQENAAAYAVEAAEKTGLPTKPIRDAATNLFRVQCGAFSSKDSANKLMRELELQGYKVHLSETEISE